MTSKDTSPTPVNPFVSNHITKQKLLKIFEVYNFYKNAQNNPAVKDIINTKFAHLVEQAEQHIRDFANNKLTISPEAISLMKDYIKEFGRNYYTYNGKKVYNYSPEAAKANIKLELIAYRSSRQAAQPKENQGYENFNPEALLRGTADEFSGGDIFNSSEASPATVVNSNSPSQKTANNFTPAVKTETPVAGAVKPIEALAHTDAPTVQMQPAPVISRTEPQQKKMRSSFFNKMKRQVTGFCKDTAKSINKGFKRYSIAAIALFSSSGTFNSYTMANAENTPMQKFKPFALPEVNPANTLDLTSALTGAQAKEFSLNQQASFEIDDNFAYFAPTLEQTIAQSLARQDSIEAAERNNITLADLPLTDIKLSSEDLEAMVPSETALKLAENAENVASRMNCEGYCFRGAKKAFRATGLGEMYGRSAYMAKHQLDKNPHFIRINSDVKDNDKLPDGGVAVFGKSSKHPHGHIGVLKDGKDCSSKIRQAMTSIGNYSRVDVYLPADTKVPERVIERINSIMVLDKHLEKKPQNKLPVSPFLLAIQNMKANNG